MIGVKLDAKGHLIVNWPGRDAEVITLGQNYVAYESSLPAEQRLLEPGLDLVQAALAQASEAVEAGQQGEQERAVAAEQYRQALDEARPLLDKAVARLKSRYFDNLAQLEAWGLDTRAGARGVSVRKPNYDKGWADFLAAYVAQEQSLPEAERITDPSLDELAALAQRVESSLGARRSGRDQREVAIETRTEAADRLLQLLQAAAVVIVVTRYEGRVTNDLQWWGYEVVARTGVPESETPEQEQSPV